ncbi:hypothetical protein D3C86_1494990 [compost metagenome]
MQHMICHFECIREGCLRIGNPEQVLIGDDDHRICAFAETLDSLPRCSHSLSTFECEGQGDDADRQYACLACSMADNGCGTCSRSASHARCHETHMGSVELIHDLVNRLFGGRLSNIGQ